MRGRGCEGARNEGTRVREGHEVPAETETSRFVENVSRMNVFRGASAIAQIPCRSAAMPTVGGGERAGSSYQDQDPGRRVRSERQCALEGYSMTKQGSASYGTRDGPNVLRRKPGSAVCQIRGRAVRAISHQRYRNLTLVTSLPASHSRNPQLACREKKHKINRARGISARSVICPRLRVFLSETVTSAEREMTKL